MFRVSDTHYAATWLLDERAPHVEMPAELRERVARMMKGGETSEVR
jgi:oligopeptide transport system ATP-binding protein